MSDLSKDASAKETRGEWVRRMRSDRDWSQADLGRRVGVTGSAIGLFENADKTKKNLSDEVWERIKRALGGGPDGEEVEYAEIGHVTDSASIPKETQVQIGTVSVWDCLLYTCFKDFCTVCGASPQFEHFEDWGHSPLIELQVGNREALIHNYFLLEASKRGRRQSPLSMTHPLYVFRGQFIFVTRKHLLRTIDDEVDGAVKKRLEQLAKDRYVNSGDGIEFPRLDPTRDPEEVDKKALRAILERARFGYAEGTDLELAVNQLHVLAGYDEQETRTKLAASRDEPWMKKSSEEMLEMFSSGSIDVLCGGLAYYWHFATNYSGDPSDGITLIDPHDLEIPSLNGIVAPLEATGRPELDAIAKAFYAGAAIFANNLRQYKKDGLSREFIHHVFRLIDQQMPTYMLGKTGETDVLEQDAYLRARLMSQYVVFFKTPFEANKFVKGKEFDEYRHDVVELLGRSRQ